MLQVKTRLTDIFIFYFKVTLTSQDNLKKLFNALRSNFQICKMEIDESCELSSKIMYLLHNYSVYDVIKQIC